MIELQRIFINANGVAPTLGLGTESRWDSRGVHRPWAGSQHHAASGQKLLISSPIISNHHS